MNISRLHPPSGAHVLFAYIITRPLGASFSDWLAAPTATGGPHWGTGPVSLALTAAIIALVGYLNAVDRKTAKP